MKIEPETKEWIELTDIQEFVKNPFEKGWLLLHKSSNEKNQYPHNIFAYFIKKEFRDESLKDISWDFHGDNILCCDPKIEPVVFLRNFHGLKKVFPEVSQRFIHFFNLYLDENGKKLIFIDEAGDDIEVIIIENDLVKVRLDFLFEYMHANNFILSWVFDSVRYHEKTLNSYGLEENKQTVKDDKTIYSIGWGNFDFSDGKTQSWLMGKTLIEVPAEFKPNILEPEEKFEEFIIEVDDSGKEQIFTCDESKLANYFGANPDAPFYTTSVFFKKEVLSKYYSYPSKYSVEDGYLSCQGLWGIRIDNNVKDNVAVFLGDLGRLPYKEQKHWKLYNIPIGKISDPFFRRNFNAEFCSPSNPAEYFKEKMLLFGKRWKKRFGWYLFKLLNKEDEHHWKTLRLPNKDSQHEFDNAVLSLGKILIDSLNQEEMKKDLTFDKDDGSITILSKYLEQKHKLRSKQMITFLRNLWDIRSKCSAHRKGTDYNKFYSKFDKGDFSKTFENILVGSITVLNTLEGKILDEK